MFSIYIAQAAPTEAGLKILKASTDLAQRTANSWNQVWESVINPDNPLWAMICQLGILIAALSILYLALTQGVEIVQKQDWGALPAMFVPPLVIALFLGGNGGLLADAEKQAGILNALREFVSNLSILSAGESLDIALDPGQFLRDRIVPIIRTVLWATQWSFVNLLEAATFLTALLAPIAFGASLMPIQGRPAIGWITGYISLFGVQLSYNILVGLIATIIVESGGELISDLAFSLFIALFAPTLALVLVGGSGMSIYKAISANVSSLKNLASDVISGVIKVSI